MRHPIEEYDVHQAEVLASLPEGQREWMTRMFRIGRAFGLYGSCIDSGCLISLDHPSDYE